MEKVLVFDLTGPQAHFRKYYTNTSALTYGFPPRTVLTGIVAAVLGWEKDTYYEELGRGRYAVAVKTPVRRLVQTVNYTRTKKEDLGVLGRLGRVPGTQTPLEFLLPQGGSPFLRFRVFFSHPDTGLLVEAAARLEEGRPAFPLYLGITECLASVHYCGIFGPENYKSLPAGTPLEVTSVINAEHLDRITLHRAAGTNLVRERAPYAFGPGRVLQPPAAVIYRADARPIPAVLRVKAYSFELAEAAEKDTVVFWERE